MDPLNLPEFIILPQDETSETDSRAGERHSQSDVTAWACDSEYSKYHSNDPEQRHSQDRAVLAEQDLNSYLQHSLQNESAQIVQLTKNITNIDQIADFSDDFGMEDVLYLPEQSCSRRGLLEQTLSQSSLLEQSVSQSSLLEQTLIKSSLLEQTPHQSCSEQTSSQSQNRYCPEKTPSSLPELVVVEDDSQSVSNVDNFTVEDLDRLSPVPFGTFIAIYSSSYFK